MPFGAPLAVPGCLLAAAVLGAQLQLLLVGACVSPRSRNGVLAASPALGQTQCLRLRGPGLCLAWGGVSPPYSLHPLQAVLTLPF